MAMKTPSRIISPRRWETVVSYRLNCEHVDPVTRQVIERGWGFGFDCDSHGNPLPGMNPCALASLEGCRNGSIPVTPLELVRTERRILHAAVMRCDCGRKLSLHNLFATACDCGREYGGNGYLLAPRSQWGEETGEQGTF